MPRRCSPGEGFLGGLGAAPAKSTPPDAAEGSLRSSGEPSGVPLAGASPLGRLCAAPATRQPHGEAATEALKAWVLKQRAQLEIVATDIYGRKIGRLTVGALPVNAEMVRRGLAWAYDSTRASVRSGSESFRAPTRGGEHNDMLAVQREARRA